MARVFPLLLLLAWAMGTRAEEWPRCQAQLWSRDAGAGRLAMEGDAFSVIHSAKSDWAVNAYLPLAVAPGDLFVLSCDSERLPEGPSGGDVELSAITYDADGKVLEWCYGSVRFAPGKSASCRFVVPHGVARILPRVTGYGPVSVRVSKLTLKRERNLMAAGGLPASCTLESATSRLDIGLADGSLAFTDKRTGRVCRTCADATRALAIDLRRDSHGAVVRYVDLESAREFTASYALEEEGRELVVKVDGEGELGRPLNFPAPFETAKGESLIVPENEGMRFPVDEDHECLWRLVAYGGHGLCMSFFGVCDDDSGAGWMCILETPDDAAMVTLRAPQNRYWRIGPSWEAQKGRFGYQRSARYVLLDRGGYVAMAKRYRAYAKKCGRLVTFREKAASRPAIDKLLGAANIWCWGCGNGDGRGMVRSLQEAGIDRILWSAGGSSEFLSAMRSEPKVVAGRYDIYQDIMDPAQRDNLPWWHPDWVTEAFPHDINWAGPSSDQWRRGWPVDSKQGPRISCAVICDSRALPYARERISRELKTLPFESRFIDTTTAAPWFECWNPAHPMTRTESRVWKMRLLELVSKDFGLVCGCETGHDASVPYCDYFEGMLSIGPYRIDEAGRDMGRIVDEVPARTAKYQVGEKYRLPLWELVYHDCVVAQWYWGDYNNKLPKIWHKRDLFNALYGTPPMYMFTASGWNAIRDRVAASYRVAAPVARLSAYSEMVDHRSLTPDRSVQRSRFANGTTVTVNFGPKPFAMEDGSVLAPSSARW